jgi:sulfatase modifying factor 1
MHGNVNEWCSDWHGDYSKGVVSDPVGPREGEDRVVRGGIWGGPAESGRSAGRYWRNPSVQYFDGFRVALSSESETSK